MNYLFLHGKSHQQICLSKFHNVIMNFTSLEQFLYEFTLLYFFPDHRRNQLDNDLDEELVRWQMPCSLGGSKDSPCPSPGFDKFDKGKQKQESESRSGSRRNHSNRNKQVMLNCEKHHRSFSLICKFQIFLSQR